jgi:hypothetical protein
MKNFRNYFKKENWGKGLLLSLCILLISFASHAGSIKDVSQNIKKVKSIDPPFQFALIGDSRDGEKVYTQLMSRILERKPDFIIHLGDMITKPHGKEWQAFFEISRPIDRPFFPVVGNHDVGTTRLGEEMYRKQFVLPERKTYYAFRAGGGLFMVLDSEKGKGRIIDEQRVWLDDVLSSSQESFKLVFIHRPLFLPIGSFKMGKGMDKYPFDRDDLHRLFVKAKVKAVFAADDHRYDRRERRIMSSMSSPAEEAHPSILSKREEDIFITCGSRSKGEGWKGR